MLMRRWVLVIDRIESMSVAVVEAGVPFKLGPDCAFSHARDDWIMERPLLLPYRSISYDRQERACRKDGEDGSPFMLRVTVACASAPERFRA